jgi:uncharacterized protein (DUF1501 family)
MKDTRRSFLKKSALISASVLIPDFLKAFGSLANPQQFIGKRLVVIQLSGGNDGLNCVVPFRNDEYFKLRPGIGLEEKQRIKITEEVALNSSLAGLADLYNQGHLTIINGLDIQTRIGRILGVQIFGKVPVMLINTLIRVGLGVI